MKKYFMMNTLGDKLAHVFIEMDDQTIYRITTRFNDGVVLLKPMDQYMCKGINFRAYQRFGKEACQVYMREEAIKNGHKCVGVWND